MIIDTHAHFGNLLFEMPIVMLLESMKKYNIDMAIVSSINATEVDFDQNPIEQSLQTPQEVVWLDTIELCKKYKERIKCALWVKIREEKDGSKWENFIKQYRDEIYALKFHPYHSDFSFDSKEVRSYVEIAEKYDLPILVHTATDNNSSVECVKRVALDYPKVKFVMVHLGLGSDNLKALEIIKTIPNVYGDSTWVKKENILKAIKESSNKIMFGTDSPIDGLDTYNNEIYQFCFNDLKKLVTQEQYERFMYKNACEIFKLK